MLFNSLDFLLFFPIVTLIYFLLPHRFRWVHLLAASCIFYMWFIPVFILILIFTITVDYFAGIAIEKASGRRRKTFMVMSLACNLGVLIVFKYAHFLTLADQFHFSYPPCAGIGTAVEYPAADRAVISHFSGHELYDRGIQGELPGGEAFRDICVVCHVLSSNGSGPIERPQGLLRQLRDKHVFNRSDLGVGLRLMLWGFFKKLVIADRLAGYVNYVYGNVDHLSSWYIVLAVVFFSFQIYCDFSGYTDIAIGAARTMGFRLAPNFNRPYSSANVREFWTRWHISLSTWFRDYVYIPMGGNRVSKGTVFSDHIEFQVDPGAGDDGLDIGVFEGIGDDGDIEFRFFYIENGQAGAVEADGAFFDDEVAEFFGEFEPEFPAAVEVFAFEADGGGVDVSLDDVAVEAAVHDQASFEVDEVAGLPVAEAGLF
jgi:alginate O-acetyltransferase complex protein AlgI